MTTSASSAMRVRIGVDVGGTNTDAVALIPQGQQEAHRGVLAFHKTPTTSDITGGITTAVRSVIDQAKIAADAIECVVVGTTHFLNAVLERDQRRLRRVAVLRLSKSFLREVPPFSDFPEGLAEILRGYIGYCDGGLNIDGSEEAPVIEQQVVERCQEISKLGLKSVVIVGVFSPIDETFRQEERVRDIVLREIPGIDVVVSREVAGIGLIERENASLLNAAILPYARSTIRSLQRAMRNLEIDAPLYLSQNDGTVLDAVSASKFPIRTFASGATNSMRGAAYLSAHDRSNEPAIVVDIGGTTSDVGMLLPSGLPRQAAAYVTVAGVRVNYSMPHLHSIGLGGGSIVRTEKSKTLSVGPDSVGHELTRRALCFGGDVPTATDVAVAAGQAQIGSRIPVELGTDVVEKGQETIAKLLEHAIDVIKTSPEPITILMVGGGACLAPQRLAGGSELRRPPFHDIANAVGAAMSRVGGTVDMIQSIAHETVSQVEDKAKALATQRAIGNGAIPETVLVAEVDTYPVTYVANQLRVVVKAIGELGSDRHAESEVQDVGDELGEIEVTAARDEFASTAVKVSDVIPVDHFTYRPNIVLNEYTGCHEWLISETDLDYLADGCYVLGCAGGGTPHPARVQLRDMLRAGHTMRVVDTNNLDPTELVYWGGFMGSPATSVERLQATEGVLAMKDLMEYLGHDTKSIGAMMSVEIGGANGLEPFLWASSRFFDRPILDADAMGRAYPTFWQTTIAVWCPGELVPCCINSGDGKTIIMTKAANDEIVDRALRASCSEMGSRVGLAARPTTIEKAQKFAVLNTVSLAWRVGRCIARAEACNTLATVAEQIVDEVGGPRTAQILFRGKIIAVERSLYKGHSYGSVTISPLATSEAEDTPGQRPATRASGKIVVPFKNENIYVQHEDENGAVTILASVPDLICILDLGSGRSLGVPEFRYGQRVAVLAITCAPQWTDSEEALKAGGPAAFGYHDIKYRPVGVYVKPKSVIEEFA